MAAGFEDWFRFGQTKVGLILLQNVPSEHNRLSIFLSSENSFKLDNPFQLDEKLRPSKDNLSNDLSDLVKEISQLVFV